MSSEPNEPFALTPAVAADAAMFAQLLNSAYRVPIDASGRRALADNDVMQRVAVTVSSEFKLADWAMMRLAPDETLTPYQYGMLDVSEKIIMQLAGTPVFHPQFGATLAQYRGVFAAAAMPADGWITNPQHPARRLLAGIFAAAIGWHPELGSAAFSMRTHAESWLAGVAANTHTWAQAATQSTDWLADEKRRTDRIEKRLVEAEAGIMRERRTRQLAARTINQSFANRLIGTEAAQMLVNDWLPAMQSAVLRQGEQSLLWQRLKRTTATLRWTLSPELGEEARNKLLRLITQVSDDLTELAPQLFYEEATRNRVIEVLEHEHLCVVRDLPRETVPFTPIDTHDVLADASASLSENLLDKVRALAPGDWLVLNEGHISRRARVLIRDDEMRQLLLVNALGVKVLSAPYEKIALALLNGTAERLSSKVPLHAAIATVLDETRALHQQAQQSRIEQLRIAREQAVADARSKEIARQKALAEAQVLEAARQEATRRAEVARQEADTVRETAEVARQDAEYTARVSAQQGQQRARLMVSSLTIGAWVVFRESDGRIERRRLTVILPSSGKCIFVDADGVGKREITRDELIRGFSDGSISPLSKDQKIDDALARVVGNLRNERNPPGSMS